MEGIKNLIKIHRQYGIFGISMLALVSNMLSFELKVQSSDRIKTLFLDEYEKIQNV